MKAIVYKCALAAVITPMASIAALAQSANPTRVMAPSARSVPEIDASTGVLAIAAVAAALALAWEIKRRRNA